MPRHRDRSLILSVCIGGFLEFYEFNLFIYLAPILAQHYFVVASEKAGLIYTLLIFAAGFLSRPIGGLLFGYLGDHFGRKIALVSSIIMITIPTLSFSILPGIFTIGITAPIIFLLLRLVQGILTGGEISGIMCYLTEGIAPERRSYISSWTFFGPQLGVLVAILECLILEQQFTHTQFINWGWRISFLVGGCIGLIGCFLRYRLHETPLFAKIKAHKQILRAPILTLLSTYKKHILLAMLLCALPITCNFLVFSFSSIYFEQVLELSFSTSLILNALINALCMIALPIFGKLAKALPIRPLLIACAITLLFLAYPFYIALNTLLPILAIPFTIIITLLIAAFFALIPMVLAELFPTQVRYTAIGISFTSTASILGGTAPILAITFIHLTQNPASPAFLIIFASALTLIGLFRLKETKTLS